jgi:VWFA-related protein
VCNFVYLREPGIVWSGSYVPDRYAPGSTERLGLRPGWQDRRDLGKSAFTVYENGEKQTLNVFRQDDVPISLGLIIDTSASMTNKRDRVASAALAMVKASNPQDEVFIINFNESAVLAKEFTNDIKDLEKALRNLDAKGETAMRDALLLGSSTFGTAPTGTRRCCWWSPTGKTTAASRRKRTWPRWRSRTT